MAYKYPDCPSYLKEFLTYLSVVKGRTEKTVDSYYFDLSIFLRYLKLQNDLVDTDIPFDEITISDVPISLLESFTLLDAYEFLNYLATERKNNSTSRARRTTSLKAFFNYLCEKTSKIKNNPLTELERPKEAKTLPKYLELDQSLKLLQDVDSKNRERDYCIITLFLNCGMRLSELVGLNISDYSESSRTLRVFGKGQKERIIYINDACISALNAYLAVRPKSEVEPNAIFISSHSNHLNRLTTRRVQRIVEDQLKRAGLGNLGLSTHKLRHTAATLMYEYGGVDPMVLKDVLGHASVATTQIYTHLSDRDRRKAAENSPLANVKNLTNKSKEDESDNE